VGTRWVFDFVEGGNEMRDVLGGKGANVAEMTRLLGQQSVPPGFTIITTACVEYARLGREPEGVA
jgi:pyruvate,orthophosphate dikinase